MSSFIEFIIVRHGETADNASGILQGQLNSPLNTLGQQQAHCAAQALRAMHFDAVYSSDLLRASQTAAIIAQDGHDDIKVTTLPGLREWHLGIYEGRLQCELLAEDIDILRSLRIEEAGDRIVPDGESKLQFFARIRNAMQDIAHSHHAGQRILLVSHGGAMQVIFRMAIGGLQVGAAVPLPDNASYSRIRFFPTDSRWQLFTWNEHAHLDAVGVHNTLIF